jgi:hypothetical protein
VSEVCKTSFWPLDPNFRRTSCSNAPMLQSGNADIQDISGNIETENQKRTVGPR